MNIGGVGAGGQTGGGFGIPRRVRGEPTQPSKPLSAEERVQKIKEAVASGLYQPNSHQIAAAIIAAARQRSKP